MSPASRQLEERVHKPSQALCANKWNDNVRMTGTGVGEFPATVVGDRDGTIASVLLHEHGEVQSSS